MLLIVINNYAPTKQKQISFSQLSALLLLSKEIKKSDVYRLAKMGRCTTRLNLIYRKKRVITGLPLFDIKSNQKKIRAAMIKVSKKCRKKRKSLNSKKVR